MTRVRCNLHTHTSFCDGKDAPEDIVLSAISLCGDAVGFSAHSPTVVPNDYGFVKKDELDAYQGEILRLKEKYSDQLEILLGIERDYFSSEADDVYDFVIGSVHYIFKNGVYIPMDIGYSELMQGIDEAYGGNVQLMAEEYYKALSELPSKTKCDIIGHFDILTKYNDKYRYIDENSKEYRMAALSALDLLMSKDMLIEVNTGAMLRGYKTKPYPAPFIVKHIADKGGRVILGSDSHSKDTLFGGFEEAVEYLKAYGIKEVWIYKQKKQTAVKI